MRRWGFRKHIIRGPRRVPLIHEKYFSMADAVPGRKYRLVRINGGYRINSRLCAMGFIPGEIFYISGASRGGPRCVIIKGTKFAIGRGMAERIQVEEI